MIIRNKKISSNIDITLRSDLCTGCGICEGICPKGAIRTICDNGNFRPRIDKDVCIDCGRCVKVCPGLGVKLKGIADELFPKALKRDNTFGRYEQCYTGYSNDYDIRYHSASGGLVSQFIIWLLQKKKIDGAVITKFDPDNDFLVNHYIATTKEEVVLGRGSRYSPVSLNHAIQDIKAAKGTRYVVVGLPCHIQGFRKAMAIDKELARKVIGLFAIYCSCGRSFNMTEFIFKERGISKDRISYFQYRDEGCLGKMVIKGSKAEIESIKTINPFSSFVLSKEEYIYKEDYQSYYHPLRSFFIPRRCTFCIDHYGELSDVSFGDIHIKPYSDDKVGVNSVIVRSKEWLNLLKICEQEGAVMLEEISFETISKSQKMSFVKKGRYGAFINIAKKLGMIVPQYDVDYLRNPRRRDWIDYVQTRFQQFLGKNRSLWFIVSRLKATVNIH